MSVKARGRIDVRVGVKVMYILGIRFRLEVGSVLQLVLGLGLELDFEFVLSKINVSVSVKVRTEA